MKDNAKKKLKKVKLKQIFTAVLSVTLVLSGLWLIQALLMPKYMHGIVEGAMIAEYYEEEKNHDVIFIGDCELYENISPLYCGKNMALTVISVEAHSSLSGSLII